jgi:transposase-like protein
MTQGNSKINGFTPAEALETFSGFALSQSVVSPWVFSKLHPNNVFTCPACGDPIKSERSAATFRSGGRVACLSCKKFFTNRTNTILHASQLEFEQVYLIAVLLAFADRVGADRIAARREIARIVGLHPDSIKNWQENFTALETPLV